MDGRPDVSGWKQRVKGKQVWMTRKEVAGRRTWNQSIAQSVRRGPIYSNFTRECAASLPQQQSINQWKRRGPIYNLVYTAYSAFLHTASKSGTENNPRPTPNPRPRLRFDTKQNQIQNRDSDLVINKTKSETKTKTKSGS